MVTLIKIRTNVRTFLDEVSEADWTNTELDYFINQAYHEVASSVMETFEDYYMSVPTFSDSVEDQQEYVLPTDFHKIRRVEINYDTTNDDSNYQRALPSNIDEVRGRLENTDFLIGNSRNPVYYLVGDRIGFLPILNENGTDAIKILYIKEIADMDEDTDEIDIPYPERYYKLIVLRATADALRKGQQESVEADKLDVKFEKGLEKMKRELEDRVSEEGKTIIDVSNDNLEF